MSDHWKIGKEKKKGIKREIEKAVLVGVISDYQTEEQVKEYLDELEFLAMTAGAETVGVFTQKMKGPNVRTYVGKGKVEEILE